MEFKYTSIYEWGIYLIIFLNLGFLNIFSGFSKNIVFLTAIIAVVLVLIYFTQGEKNRNILDLILKINIFCIILIYFLNILKFLSSNNFSSSVGTAIAGESGWLLLLISFPFAVVLSRGNSNFLRNIAYLGLAILVLKFIVWFLYNYFSILLAPGYFRLGLGWQRAVGSKMLTRMDGTFLDPFTFFYFYFKFKNSNVLKEKVISALVLCFILGYEYFVYQSRSTILYLIMAVIIGELFLLLKSENKIQSLILFFLVILILFIIFKDQIFSFVSTFDPTNTQNSYSSSSMARIYEINYFKNLWQSGNSWLGFGLINDQTFIGGMTFYLSDIGILAYLFEYGYIGFFIFVFPLILGFICIIVKKINKFNLIDSILIMLLIYLVISQVNLNMYWFNQATLLPICLGLLLYFNKVSSYTDDL